MKPLLLILLLCAPVKAALPDVITDPATRDTVEYLDAKLTQIITSTSGIRGPQGYQGPKGDTGNTGPAGATGPAGTAATVTVGSTVTGAEGSPATVTNTGTTSAAVFDFSIPQGIKGDKGDAGDVSFTSTGTFSGTISMTNPNNVYYGSGNNLTFKKAVFNNLTITGNVRGLNVIQ